MLPELLRIGPIPIRSYGLMIAVGFLVTMYFTQRDARKFGLEPQVLLDCAFYALPLGILGTRILYILMFPEYFSWRDPVKWIAVWEGGLVFQGAVPVVVVFVWFYLKRHGVDFWKACDVVFPYIALGHGFGRIGCFLYGCCYGKPTDVPWAIPARRVPWDVNEPVTGSPAFIEHLGMFPDVTVASHWSHPIHPTQLYEAAGLWAMCGVMLLLRKHWRPYVGFTMPAYFVIYSALRFVIEEYRGDNAIVLDLGIIDLTTQQVFSAGFAVFGVILYFILKPRRAVQRI